MRIGFSDQVWRDHPRGHPEGAAGPEGCPLDDESYNPLERIVLTSKHIEGKGKSN